MILKRAVFDGERDADVASNSPKPSVDTTPNESKKEESARSGPRGYFMFLGDTVPSFYRRPSSSFDGLFTVIPCGRSEQRGRSQAFTSRRKWQRHRIALTCI